MARCMAAMALLPQLCGLHPSSRRAGILVAEVPKWIARFGWSRTGTDTARHTATLRGWQVERMIERYPMDGGTDWGDLTGPFRVVVVQPDIRQFDTFLDTDGEFGFMANEPGNRGEIETKIPGIRKAIAISPPVSVLTPTPAHGRVQRRTE